ncbi:MAG TPA: hypothetical protein VHM94_13625 [Acidimicrobiia bacterium]|nr:hypothetical protein [Acidimicrobiia bacterium]
MTERRRARIEPAVALGSSARSWAGELMSYAKDHPGVRVVGTVLSSADAMEIGFDVLILDDTSSFLTPRLIDRLQRSDRAVIGVYDPERGGPGRSRLLEMGVDAVVIASSPPEDLVETIEEVVERRDLVQRFAEVLGPDLTTETEPQSTAPPQPMEEAEQFGRVVAVTGASGVLEVLVGLGIHLAGWRRSTLLADLDTLEPALAQRLDVELTPNVITALEALRFRSDLTREFAYHAGGFAVLGGIPNPREWATLAEDEIIDLLGQLRLAFQMVLIRIDRHLEDLSTLTGAAGRFGASRSVAAAADVIVGVGDPSPVGVAGMLNWLGDLSTVTSAPVHLVLNRIRPGPFQRHEVMEELRRSFTPASVTLLPEDNRLPRASWQGEPVYSGKFMKALAPLAAALGAVGQPMRAAAGAHA